MSQVKFRMWLCNGLGGIGNSRNPTVFTLEGDWIRLKVSSPVPIMDVSKVGGYMRKFPITFKAGEGNYFQNYGDQYK